MTTLQPPFTYSPITERAPIHWPGGARVAVYIGLNVEHFLPDRPSTSIWPGTAELTPDALTYGWSDYGARVGIWRTIEALDRHSIRPSVLLNSAVIEHHPQIVAAGVERDWT
nr:polysaccharide deacetylase [Streptomyces sp. DSM 41633]